jgi:hypothetical protein
MERITEMRTIAITALVALLIGAGVGSQRFPKTKEVTRPDGTKESTTTTTDKSVEKKSATATKVTAQSKWAVGVTAAKGLDTLSQTLYTVNVDYRLAGPLFLKATVNTDKQLGVGVQIEF